MTHQPVSKYAPIWKQLKEKKLCKVTAPIQFHKMIIKGVLRRRDNDMSYKFEMAERNLSYRIRARVQGTVITFTLTEYLSLSGL